MPQPLADPRDKDKRVLHPLAFVVGSPAAIALALVCATAVAQPYPSKPVRIVVHVPYKGSGPAVADLLAGQVQTRFSSIPPALPHVRTGRLRALAVTSTGRFNLLPDIPAVTESLRGFEVNSFQSGSRTLVGS